MQECEHCHLYFARSVTLKRHLESKHADRRKRHQCPNCHEFFARHDILERHKLRHLDSVTGSCPRCSQSYSRKDYLSKHVKNCQGKRPLSGQSVIRSLVRPTSIKPVADAWEIPGSACEEFSPALWNTSQASVDGSPTPWCYQIWEREPTAEVVGKQIVDNQTTGEQLPQPTTISRSETMLGIDQCNKMLDREVQTVPVRSHVHNGELGQGDVEHLPVSNQSRPESPCSLVAKTISLRDAFPNANIEASTEPGNVCRTTGVCNSIGPPERSMDQHIPTIRCLDCHGVTFPIQPDESGLSMEDHLLTASHKSRVTSRLLAGLDTIKQALEVVTGGDADRTAEWLAELIKSDSHWPHFNHEYFEHSEQSLHALAVRNDDIQLLRHLLEKWPSFNVGDRSPRTPLHWACAFGRAEMAELLIEHGAPLQAGPCFTNTPLDLAVVGDHLDTAVRLVEFETKSLERFHGRTPLERACKFGRVEIIDRLLKIGADPNERGSSYPIEQAMIFASSEAVALLLDAGAMPDVLSRDIYESLARNRKRASADIKMRYLDADDKLALLAVYGILVTVQVQ